MLEPMKLAVEALCRKDATLLTAEESSLFIFSVEEEENLLSCVKNRIQQKRQYDIFNLIRNLQNRNLSIHDEHDADDMSLIGRNTKDDFVKTATTLFCRLSWENDSNEGRGKNENEDMEVANNTNKNQEHESFPKTSDAHGTFHKLHSHPVGDIC